MPYRYRVQVNDPDTPSVTEGALRETYQELRKIAEITAAALGSGTPVETSINNSFWEAWMGTPQEEQASTGTWVDTNTPGAVWTGSEWVTGTEANVPQNNRSVPPRRGWVAPSGHAREQAPLESAVTIIEGADIVVKGQKIIIGEKESEISIAGRDLKKLCDDVDQLCKALGIKREEGPNLEAIVKTIKKIKASKIRSIKITGNKDDRNTGKKTSRNGGKKIR